MYDNNVLVKPVNVKVLREGESKLRVVAFFSIDRRVLFLSSPLENAVMNLSSLNKRCLKKGLSSLKFLIILRRGLGPSEPLSTIPLTEREIHVIVTDPST